MIKFIFINSSHQYSYMNPNQQISEQYDPNEKIFTYNIINWSNFEILTLAFTVLPRFIIKISTLLTHIGVKSIL